MFQISAAGNCVMLVARIILQVYCLLALRGSQTEIFVFCINHVCGGGGVVWSVSMKKVTSLNLFISISIKELECVNHASLNLRGFIASHSLRVYIMR